MLAGSLIFTLVLGLPLGVLLFLTGKRQLLDQPVVYGIVSFVVNVLRSVPFVILLIIMIPFTVLVAGTSLGVAGAIPPLVVGATPFLPVWLKRLCAKWTVALLKPRKLWEPAPGKLYLVLYYPKRCPVLWRRSRSQPLPWSLMPPCPA